MDTNVSISTLVKDELTSLKISANCCKRAFLSGIIRGAGSFYVDHTGFGVIISLANHDLIKKCVLIVKNIIGIEPDVVQHAYLREVGNKTTYEIKLNSDVCFDVLTETYVASGIYELYDGIAPELIKKDCCTHSFLRGLFLASGTISAPPKSSSSRSRTTGYYLDMTVASEKTASDLIELLAKLDLTAKARIRGEQYSVYLKDAEMISDFLVGIGSMSGALELQDILATRSLHNVANRQANCLNANIDKTVDAGLKQVAAIEKIKSKRGLNFLDEALRQTAEARLQNPEMSLQELADMLPGGPSKSCLNHRFRKLLSIAAELEDK